ncbi:hypothetical protein [uncultured Corynebacterium sp.]
MMEKGRLVEHGRLDDLFDHPKEAYTKNLIESVPGLHIEIGTGENLGLTE